MTSAETIARALGGVRSGDGWLVHCPVPSHGKGRGDKNRSLSVRDGHSAILFKCHAGCLSTDALATMSDLGLLENVSCNTISKVKRVHKMVDPGEPESDARALELWRSSDPIDGTLAERYLKEHRGLDGPYPPSLRFLPHATYSSLRLPAMVAALSRPDRKIVAVQLTFLRARDGQKARVNSPRINVGRMGSGAVHLGVGDVAGNDHQLGLAEGIETALSAAALSGVPTWATLSAARLARITLPAAVRIVHLFADNGKSGLVAAEKAVERYERLGKRVVLHKPAPQFGDFNDWWRRQNGGG